jgi:hypothetical protein
MAPPSQELEPPINQERFTASLVGQHNAAVKTFLDTNDISYLRPFEGRTVKDKSRRTYVLETRPNVIRRLDASGETFEQIYRILQ